MATWAAYVALHLPGGPLEAFQGGRVRANLVRHVLSLGAAEWAGHEEQQRFLVERLGIPRQWVAGALAVWERYRHQPQRRWRDPSTTLVYPCLVWVSRVVEQQCVVLVTGQHAMLSRACGTAPSLVEVVSAAASTTWSVARWHSGSTRRPHAFPTYSPPITQVEAAAGCLSVTSS